MKNVTLKCVLISIIYFLSISSLSASSLSGLVEAPPRVTRLIVYLEPKNKIKHVPKATQISQKNTQFNPTLSIITTGDSIHWTNDEAKDIDHNIFSLSPLNRFDLGLGAKGTKLKQTFNNTGILNYYCSVHKTMEGKIIILPSHYYQLLEKPDQFTIDNLPQGEWTLNAIVFHRRYKAVPIQLTIGKESIQNLNLKVIKR